MGIIGVLKARSVIHFHFTNVSVITHVLFLLLHLKVSLFFIPTAHKNITFQRNIIFANVRVITHVLLIARQNPAYQ
jgi:hypothetical protein